MVLQFPGTVRIPDVRVPRRGRAVPPIVQKLERLAHLNPPAIQVLEHVVDRCLARCEADAEGGA